MGLEYDAFELRTNDLSKGKEQWTDATNGALLVSNNIDSIRFCPPWKKWLVWNKSCWKIDDCNEVHALALDTVRSMYYDARKMQDLKKAIEYENHIRRSESLPRHEAMMKCASLDRRIRVMPDEMDLDIWVFAVQNGLIDLHTGICGPANPSQLITCTSSVIFDEKAQCPQWDTFLLRILNNDHELIRFVQKAIGWAMTGDMSEQVMFILYGSGANGKSTFLNTILSILQDYAMSTPTDTFMKKKGDSISNDIARLRGKRMVTTIEIEQGKFLSESLIKQVTGQDVMTARFLYGEYFDFVPSFKIFMATNNKPVIKGNDLGIWRRIKLIPFTVTIPSEERIPNLQNILLQEASGILNWMIEGCLLWQKERLTDPPCISEANEDYRDDMDIIGMFISDYCICNPGYRVNTKEIYEAYGKWCLETNEYKHSHRYLSLHLQDHGFGKCRDKSSRYWKGLMIKEEKM